MSDAAAAKPAAKKAPAKPKAKPTHPKSAEMVAAIKALKERGGSSLPAIKKYIAANYKCDVVKLAPFIRKALKKGVESKKIVQVKASYKMGKEEKPKKVKKKPVKKAKKPKAPKKAAAKKAKSPKKAAKKPAAKKAKTPKKAAKPAAKKPKAKKPKT